MANSTSSSLPPKHRALVLHSTRDPYDMSVMEQPTPLPGPGSAVVRILSAAVLTYAWRVYSGKKLTPTRNPSYQAHLLSAASLLLDEARLMGNTADGGLGYTMEDLMYLLTISVPFGGLRDVDVKAGEKVIITPATGTFGSAAVVAALAMGA